MLLTKINKLPFCFKLQLDGKDQRIHFDYHSHLFSIKAVPICLHRVVVSWHCEGNKCSYLTAGYEPDGELNCCCWTELMDSSQIIGYASVALELPLTLSTHLLYCMCAFQRL